jgi:hypothetical protein
MFVRLVALLALSLALAGCDSPLLQSCSSAEDVNPAGSALTSDITKAEAAGKLDRAKAAEAMANVMSAGQAYEQNHDARAFCAALTKIRKDNSL